MITELKVKGMHCKSCEMLIKDSVEDIAGVKDVMADNKSGKVRVNHDSADISNIKKTIEAEGYEVLQ